MNTIFSLSLSASLLVVMLYPVFHIMVNRCRSFRFNRLLMLSGIGLSILLPIALTYGAYFYVKPLEMTLQTSPILLQLQDNIEGIKLLQTEVSLSPHIDILPWILGLYWSGIVVLLARQILSYTHLWRIISKSEKQQMEGYVIYRHKGMSIGPFSWGRFIVLPDAENEQSILIHEKAHTLKKHWIDVSIADFFCIFMWYNPFAWMLKNLIKLNHEYEADAEVIGSDIDVLSYQRLLIAKAVGNRTLHIANNFAMSKKDFRRRVLTMSQSKSSKGIKWIAATILPALAIAAYADTTPWSVAVHNAISSYKFSTEIETVAEYADEKSIPEELPVTLITKRIPSPLTDPNPLLKQFEMSMELANKDLIPDKILVRIQADEDGNIMSATTDHDDNPEVRVAVDRATNQIVFEVVKDGGRKISTRFALPIRKTSLPM
ncbi:MAG: M56 family metallopeptidase [Staphylococcus sp.]|nr:M56 family metallopeptidase [Staphylococcus sp.]